MCGLEKPLTDFAINRATSSGRQSRCKACQKQERVNQSPEQCEYQKTYRAGRATELRDYRLRKKYGISLAQFDELLVRQGHCCAICGTPANRSSHLDHCHSTGRIRGILCSTCNTALGKFRDSPELLSSAINYLKMNQTDNREVV